MCSVEPLQNVSATNTVGNGQTVRHEKIMTSSSSRLLSGTNLKLMADEVFYGELAILGLNGTSDDSGNAARYKSKISLFKRPEANGVRPGPVNKVPKPKIQLQLQIEIHLLFHSLCQGMLQWLWNMFLILKWICFRNGL
ncbi:unnamed protein product [Heterobilharzia americana]|nr:unnamed protein product [Heterobilharzia americana]